MTQHFHPLTRLKNVAVVNAGPVNIVSVWYLIWKWPKKIVQVPVVNYNIVDIFPKLVFFPIFSAPLPYSLARGLGLGLGLGLGFMAFLSNSILIMLESHAVHKSLFFSYFILPGIGFFAWSA